MENLIPYFQPIYDTWQNEVIGYEATIRSRHDSARNLFRKAYVNGDTVTLDQKARCLALEVGLPLLNEHQKLFINISPQSISEIHHSKWWGDEFEKIPFDKIVLELTETAPVNLKKFKKDMSILRDKGLQMALDDFGRGFSNYEVILKMGKLDYLKIDKMFSSKCHKPKYVQVIKHLVRLIQDLNVLDDSIKVIAEGVEDEWQKDILQEVGVRYMQGFLFGRPFSIQNKVNKPLTQ